MERRVPGLLHDHIDGSIAVMDVIGDLYMLMKKEFPFPSIKAWLDYFQDPRQNIVEKFRTITGVVQSREALEMLGFAYGKRRADEGYGYCEAKFAPQYHVFGGLTMKQAVESMTKGLWQAQKEFGIRILPHICIGREADVETGLKIAHICLEYDGEVAMDLVCDEANHPPEKHLPAYELTLASNVRRDCHAGEWVLPEPKATYQERLLRNLRVAVRRLRVNGVSHAIPLIDDPELTGGVLVNPVDDAAKSLIVQVSLYFGGHLGRIVGRMLKRRHQRIVG